MNNILIKKIRDIQKEYLILLEKLVSQINENNKIAVLDEVQVFWYDRYDIIHIYLSYYNKDTFVFTGASYVGIEDKDHYPFMLLGKQHIFDDPIYRYAYVSRIKEKSVSNLFVDQIIKTAKDTINLLKECSNQILVLPMRWINAEIENSVDSTIVRMFDESINSIEDLLQKCPTISDIEKVLVAEVSLVSWDIGLSLEEKFNKAWQISSNYLEPFCKTDAERFYFLTKGLIHQSMEIMIFSTKYMVTPYIRNFTTFFNFILLASNIKNNTQWDNTIKQTTISFLLHEKFDRTYFENISFIKYVEVISNYQFEQKVFEQTEDINPEKLSAISQIIEKELDHLYKFVVKV